MPNVSLARPGVTHPCPTSDACWSPISAPIGGDPSRAVASPITPQESTTVGSTAAGMPRTSSVCCVPLRGVGRHQPRHGGVRVVRHVQLAAAQLPRQPGLDGAEAHVALAGALDVVEQPRHLRRRLVGCERQVVLGLRHDALHHGAQVLPAEGRRDRLAGGAIPHHRAGPLVRDAEHAAPVRRRSRSPPGRRPSTTSYMATASNSTSPGAGVEGGDDRWASATIRSCSSTTAARIVVVPTSTTRIAVIGALANRARRPGRGAVDRGIRRAARRT